MAIEPPSGDVGVRGDIPVAAGNDEVKDDR